MAKGEQGEIEMRIIEEEKVSSEDFIIPQIRELSSKGMRRELVSSLRDFVYEVEDDGIRMKFKLLKGSLIRYKRVNLCISGSAMAATFHPPVSANISSKTFS